MLTKLLITSEEAHQLVVDVLEKTNCSLNGIWKGYHKNPFKGYANRTQVKKAGQGKILKLSTRQAFQKFKKEKLKDVLNGALSVEEIQKKVKKTLKKKKISSVYRIQKKHVKNPFEGYVGIANLYKAYKGENLTPETIRSFERYFRDN